jgi:hypothetical protein
MKIIYICRDYDIKKEIDSVRKISRIGGTCRFIYAAEKKFWLLIYLKTQPRTRVHISHVPSKYKVISHAEIWTARVFTGHECRH